jgi:hypothetical protein
MAKSKPQNAVKGAAKALGYETVRANKRINTVAKDSSQPSVLRQMIVDKEIEGLKPRHAALLNATQFAKTAGATTGQMFMSYYKGLIPGVIKGVKDNILDKRNG